MAEVGRDPRVVVAARNNAQWCDIVCRTHGVVTGFHADGWVAATRPPPGYPDAVTLGAPAPDQLLARVDRSPGCSVKDSFASLDLSGDGFEMLFEAEWIHLPAAAPPAAPGSLRWREVRTADELEAWGMAHGGRSVFRPALLDDPSVAVLVATGAGGNVAAGVIGNRSGTVAGLSNLFTVAADPDEVWTGAVAALTARFPGRPLVGYEQGDDLAAARRAGFTGVSGLRVWRC